ncbi:MAG: hypothetical protein AAFO91_18035, partial [Bacteroidota bacterium]
FSLSLFHYVKVLLHRIHIVKEREKYQTGNMNIRGSQSVRWSVYTNKIRRFPLNFGPSQPKTIGGRKIGDDTFSLSTR